MQRVSVFVLIIAISAIGCKRGDSPQPPAAIKQEGSTNMAMSVRSSAFAEGERIPKQYTCDGEDLSPPLAWSGVPQGTQSLALIFDDPDAPMGTWTHWILWGLPANADSLPEDVRLETVLPGSARQGINSWHRLGWGGPCPPPGTPHRYFFKLYALDAPINPPAKADHAALEKAMQGHILETGQLMGRYGR